MMHFRQQIREAAAAALLGLPSTATRVYQSRLHPIEASKLPCLLVNTDDEELNTVSIHPMPIMDRNLTLTVRAVAKVVANLDDTLDSMIAEVESVLGGSTLGEKVKTLELQTISIEMEAESDKPVGIATMRFLTSYMTVANDATVTI